MPFDRGNVGFGSGGPATRPWPPPPLSLPPNSPPPPPAPPAPPPPSLPGVGNGGPGRPGGGIGQLQLFVFSLAAELYTIRQQQISRLGQAGTRGGTFLLGPTLGQAVVLGPASRGAVSESPPPPPAAPALALSAGVASPDPSSLVPIARGNAGAHAS